MAIVLGTNLLFSLLPVWIGNKIFSLAKHGESQKPPEDIKVNERQFKREKAPTFDPGLAPSEKIPESDASLESTPHPNNRAPWLQWSNME